MTIVNLFTNQRLTIKTTIPAGIVNRKRKIAGFPPNKSTCIKIIGQNAINAEIIEIIEYFRCCWDISWRPLRGAGIFFSTISNPFVWENKM